MKKFTLFLLLLLSFGFSAQKLDNIAAGESLTYRIHYGPLNAGYANLTTTAADIHGVPHLYVKGTGRTTGAVSSFFKVEDLYESYISLKTGLPSFYVRNVREGGYRQHLQTVFNHNNTTLTLTDKRNPKQAPKTIKSVPGIQDMLSAFYYLRALDASDLKTGSVRNLNIWIDDELFPFSVRVAGTENIRTKFGTINCLKIVPVVKSGRVFRAKEGVTLYVSNDQNHVPISIQAELAVGTLKADLDAYKNVKYPLNFRK